MTSSLEDSKCDDSGFVNYLRPDEDAIKLFVGQIPRNLTESEVRGIMEEFGSIHQLSMIKDHVTGDSKGCCFLTYHSRQSALNAMKGLHGVKILPGAKHPMQVKPAEGAIEKEEDRRLFVGMIGKETTEDDLKALFTPYGNIESCFILKERDGTSRGCAFIIYTVRKSAVLAISALHHSRTMEGCRAPLVVKFADNNKDKDKAVTKNNRFASTMDNQSGSGVSNDGWSSYAASMPPPSMTSSNSFTFPTGMPPITGFPGFPQGSALFPPPSGLPPAPGMPSAPGAPQIPGIPNLQQLQSQLQSIAALAALATNPLFTSLLNPNLALLQQLAGSTTSDVAQPANPATDFLSQAMAGAQQFNAQSFSTSTPSSVGDSSQQFYNQNDSRSAQQKEGSNLFVLHLPSEYREGDLKRLFSPYGRIVSTKVLIDGNGQSKCYGFVSYDNPVSAQSAISALNGNLINGRRLKVQLKGKREDSKPY